MPFAIDIVPNTYAALFIGPPISIAIIPPRTIPRITFDVEPILFSRFASASFITPIIGLNTNNINAPIMNTPSTGYNNVGLIPSRLSGSFENIFLSNSTIYPATKPATSAPKNPETVVPDELNTVFAR